MEILFNAIGFTKKEQFADFIDNIENDHDKKNTLKIDENKEYVEYYKSFGRNFGICIRGSLNNLNEFKLFECIPYFRSSKQIKTSFLEYYESNEYDYCHNMYIEEQNTGNELVFKIINVLEYFTLIDSKRLHTNVKISGLSTKGTVILPLAKNDANNFDQLRKWQYSLSLQKRAKNGDESAKKLLDDNIETLDEILRNQLPAQDFFSVVDGFIAAVDNSESLYTILGDIINVKTVINKITRQKCYVIFLNITGSKFEVMINVNDIAGKPSEGMRFIGNCALQGFTLFQ